MKHYKSFLFLCIVNLLLVWPFLFFLDHRYLIFVSVGLIFFNGFLLFFFVVYLRHGFSYSAFPLKDPYHVHFVFKDLKKKYSLENVRLLKIKSRPYSFFCFGGGKISFIVISEDLLERLSKQEIRCLFTYSFRMIQSGDLLFLTLLSALLFLIEKIFCLLRSPMNFFKGKSVRKRSVILIFILKILSLITRKIFYNRDKELMSKAMDIKNQSLFLWKLDSLRTIHPTKVLFFMAPLFLTNPLTDLIWGKYTSLHPRIKDRIINLTGRYPP